MELKWTAKAVSDVASLHDFLAPVNPHAAQRTIKAVTGDPRRLLENPRIGEKLEEFAPREVRRIIIGPYEIRYEIMNEVVYVLRLWHTREDR